MPTTIHVDDIAAVRAYLLADAQIAALVGTRVFCDELPDEEAASMPRPAIVINDSGLGSGGGALGMTNESNIPIGITTKDLRCYGATFVEARRVWGLAAGALKELGQTTGRVVIALTDAYGTHSVMLYSATPAAPSTTREPDVDWPLTFGTFNLMAAENSRA